MEKYSTKIFLCDNMRNKFDKTRHFKLQRPYLYLPEILFKINFLKTHFFHSYEGYFKKEKIRRKIVNVHIVFVLY